MKVFNKGYNKLEISLLEQFINITKLEILTIHFIFVVILSY